MSMQQKTRSGELSAGEGSGRIKAIFPSGLSKTSALSKIIQAPLFHLSLLFVPPLHS